MSRIGKKPINIPQGVEIKVSDNLVTVKGPMGQLQKMIPKDMSVEIEENILTVTRPSDSSQHRALHGLSRSLINNMVEGVTKGFEKTLELVGVGYRATKQGNNVNIAIGYSHPVLVEPKEGLELDVPTPNKIVVKGIDKEAVGLLAANIRDIRRPEPYKGKGIKYLDEKIRRKVGKAGK
ncbi:50S ribosomal protein L6 [Candidatus Contubernalis alkaliaceticus]|uniref:50S ribosomal protein L6 n=1 Tax=Candidatus Contubernalis alkaliaceticus TaxID=338645 RepID=UPI001F4C5186|nr:50S ribosomal protein L6 [Candidatus Contubernalis alkalaceticus]UNC90950.1 50S ribosomal protein L6 [Candidatus Contubernalis alkalaceticus]